jgi:hypothetical protein
MRTDRHFSAAFTMPVGQFLLMQRNCLLRLDGNSWNCGKHPIRWIEHSDVVVKYTLKLGAFADVVAPHSVHHSSANVRRGGCGVNPGIVHLGIEMVV